MSPVTWLMLALWFFFCDAYLPIPYCISMFIRPKDTLATQGIETHPGPSNCTLDDPDFFDFGEEELEDIVVASVPEDHPSPCTTNGCTTIFDEQHVFNKPSQGCVLVEGINVSHLPNHWPFIQHRHATFMAIGEHSTTADDMSLCKTKLHDNGWNIKPSCLDPELKHHTAGVAGIIRKPRKQQIISPRDPEFALLLNSGRCILLALDIGLTVPVLCIVIYGWTGGRTNPHARERTDGLLAAAVRECACHPRGPCIILGDVNDDVAKMRCSTALHEDGWSDLGAISSKWGGLDNLGTCQTTNSLAATRNDYIFVNQYVLPFVNKFYVEWDVNIPTHAITGFELRITDQSPKVYKNLIPTSLFDNLQDKFTNSHSEVQDNASNLGEDSTSFRKLWLRFLEPLQLSWTSMALEHSQLFQDHLEARDTDQAWALFCQILDTGYTGFMGFEGDEVRKHRGR